MSTEKIYTQNLLDATEKPCPFNLLPKHYKEQNGGLEKYVFVNSEQVCSWELWMTSMACLIPKQSLLKWNHFMPFWQSRSHFVLLHAHSNKKNTNITWVSFHKITSGPLYMRMLPHCPEMISGLRTLSNRGNFCKEVLP